MGEWQAEAGVENIGEAIRLGYEFYPDMRARELQGWFSSAILRLAGVGLAIDFMQRRQVEMMSPFANRS